MWGSIALLHVFIRHWPCLRVPAYCTWDSQHCGCAHVIVCSSTSCCGCTSIHNARLKTAFAVVCFGVTQRQVVNATQWPLTHFMLRRDGPSCYISEGQKFTVHSSMSAEAWWLFLERPKEKRGGLSSARLRWVTAVPPSAAAPPEVEQTTVSSRVGPLAFPVSKQLLMILHMNSGDSLQNKPTECLNTHIKTKSSISSPKLDDYLRWVQFQNLYLVSQSQKCCRKMLPCTNACTTAK